MEDKEKIVKERSFSKKKLAVLTDPQFGGKDSALVDEKVGFPYILDSGDFTTIVPKSLLKKLKEYGSGVVETRLDKDVEMKTAVKDVVTIAVNYSYHCSTYHKSWSCEDQKFGGSGCPG